MEVLRWEGELNGACCCHFKQKHLTTIFIVMNILRELCKLCTHQTSWLMNILVASMAIYGIWLCHMPHISGNDTIICCVYINR